MNCKYICSIVNLTDFKQIKQQQQQQQQLSRLMFLKQLLIYGFVNVNVETLIKFFFQRILSIVAVTECNYFLHKLSFKLKEKAALKNFAIFTGKHLCLLKRDSFIKKRLQHRCFPGNITKCFRTPILKNSCERLLLGLTLGSHLMVPPYDLTLWSHPKVQI